MLYAPIPALADVCVDGMPVSLATSPAGGTWSGAGVSGTTFDPAAAGAGTHTLSYSFTVGNGCPVVVAAPIVVNPLPVLTMPAIPAVRINGTPVALSGAQPAGGTWSGKGVSNGVFTPATAGLGTHTLTYSYTNALGCANQATTTITVNPIPVKLLAFKATRSGMDDVLAKWTTEQETTILHYELELAKGDDALAAGLFKKISEVSARHSNTSVEEYSFTDTEAPKFGKYHYRLKLVSGDGSVTYSEVSTVEFPTFTWRVYPNPSSGKFYIAYQIAATERLEANVYDARGRLVRRYQRQGSGALQRLDIDLSASSYATGVYMLQTVVNGRKEFFKLHKL